jgi:hypothetical protein
LRSSDFEQRIPDDDHLRFAEVRGIEPRAQPPHPLADLQPPLAPSIVDLRSPLQRFNGLDKPLLELVHAVVDVRQSLLGCQRHVKNVSS